MIKNYTIGLLTGYIITRLPFWQFDSIAQPAYIAVVSGIFIAWAIRFVEDGLRKDDGELTGTGITVRSRNMDTDQCAQAQIYLDAMIGAIMPLPKASLPMVAFVAEEIAKTIRRLYTPAQAKLELQLKHNCGISRAYLNYKGTKEESRKEWEAWQHSVDGGES